MFKKSADEMLKAVFPNTCALCGEVIELDATYCEDCSKVKRLEAPICFHCGAPKSECVCKKHNHEYKGIIAPYYYKNSIIRAVHNFKGKDFPQLSYRFSEDMLKCIDESYGDVDFDYVTFVPLRWLHELNRGFNQSELLANLIGETLGVAVEPMLRKRRYTGVQHKKTAKNRKVAVYGAYEVYDKYSDLLEDKTVLLIDDVKTTGSTLGECAKMLKLSGAKAVYACTFAITKKKAKD